MKVKINRNITANGKKHPKGSTVDLDDKDAKSLISRGFAEEVKTTKSKANNANESKPN